MPPRRIPLAARTAQRTCNAQILFIRYADDDFVTGNADDFAARLLELRNVLENLYAKHTIEGVVRELKLGHIAGYRGDAWMINTGLLEIQSGHIHGRFRQQSRVVSLPGSNIQDGTPAPVAKRSKSFVRACSDSLDRYSAKSPPNILLYFIVS